MKEKGHIVADTVGTLKSAIELQKTFTKLQAMETAEQEQEKIQLQQEAAIKGMEALWRGSKLEVESVLREVCDKALGDLTLSVEMRRRRAKALLTLGQVYESV
jgi:hypothetical protein